MFFKETRRRWAALLEKIPFIAVVGEVGKLQDESAIPEGQLVQFYCTKVFPVGFWPVSFCSGKPIVWVCVHHIPKQFFPFSVEIELRRMGATMNVGSTDASGVMRKQGHGFIDVFSGNTYVVLRAKRALQAAGYVAKDLSETEH